jgi:hypothetical protein
MPSWSSFYDGTTGIEELIPEEPTRLTITQLLAIIFLNPIAITLEIALIVWLTS